MIVFLGRRLHGVVANLQSMVRSTEAMAGLRARQFIVFINGRMKLTMRKRFYKNDIGTEHPGELE